MFESGAVHIFIGIVVIVTAWITYEDKNRSLPSFLGSTIVGAFVGAIAILFLMVLAGTSHSRVSDSDIEDGRCVAYYEDIPLISIERDKTMSGSFFIGSGSISSNVYYFAYVETKDGMFLNKYPRYKSYIVEYDGDPKAVTTNHSCSRPFFAWLRGVEEAPTRYKNSKYQLYVPKGTIIRDFTL